MFRLIKLNLSYLFISFLIVANCIILIGYIILYLDPSEKMVASDKFVHFYASSFLSFFIYFILSFQEKLKFAKKYKVFLSIFLATVIGTLVEIIQIFIPNRSVNIYDWIANFIGAFFTVLIIKYIPRSIKNMRRTSEKKPLPRDF